MTSIASRLFKKLVTPMGEEPERAWFVPDGQRVYAIGDVHGRLDLLIRLLDLIERDDAARGAARTTLVFLGDFVNRGPDSRKVIDFLMRCAESGNNCVFLAGNHDDVFMHAALGERGAARELDRMGGRATALSYGISAEEYDRGGYDDLARLYRERVPAEHVAFLRSFSAWHQIGEYIFVHAGIMPGVPMHEQAPGDLRWIRHPFLEYRKCHEAMIVHGHTVTEAPDVCRGRIGIDTGAYRTGTLTAIGLEGADRWFLHTPG